MEKNESASAIIKVIAGVLAVAVCILIFLAVFTSEQRRAQYAGYARQVYYDAVLYQSTTFGAPSDIYDSSDDTYYYITDPDRLSDSYTYEGKIKVAFDRFTGELAYASWEKEPPFDWIDYFVPPMSTYP